MRYSALLPATAIIAAVMPGAPLFAQDPSPSPSPTSAKAFVTEAAIGDLYEVEAGKLAEEKGSAAGVKSFGRHMVAAHTETTAKLKAAVAKSGLTIAPPSGLDARHRKMLDQLKAATGADFDQTYISQQEAAHQEALKLMQTYSNAGDDDVLKKAAAATVRVVRQHISMLAKLKT